MSIKRRIEGLRFRENLFIGEAAYFVQNKIGGTWEDAVALISEAIINNRLHTDPKTNKPDHLTTKVSNNELQHWLSILFPVPEDPSELVESRVNKRSETINRTNNETLPRNAIGKLSIEAARSINIEGGIPPSPRDVMSLLQRWAQDGSHQDVLDSEIVITKNRIGVKWVTDKGKQKIFDLECCAKIIKTYKHLI